MKNKLLNQYTIAHYTTADREYIFNNSKLVNGFPFYYPIKNKLGKRIIISFVDAYICDLKRQRIDDEVANFDLLEQDVANREALVQRGMKITDIPAYRELDFDRLENLQMVAITDIDRTKREDERIPELTSGGKIYYECAVSAVRDKDHRLHGVIAAGRNITDMVDSYHRQQQDTQLLQKRTKDIKDYIDNINYSLKVP